MKTSIFLAATSALLAMAGPLVNKRAMETETVTDIVYTTVYEDEVPLPTKSMFNAGPHRRPLTSTPEPSPESTPEPTSESPAPAPERTETPAPPPEPTEQATPPPADPPVVQVAAPTNVVAAEPTDMASAAVYHHNLHRDNHSAPAISWSDTYAGYAAEAAASCKFQHDLSPGGGGYGQNIAMYAATDLSSKTEATAIAEAITMMWYNGEFNLFTGYGQPSPDMSDFERWGHLTQVVWKGSTQVGCHVKRCPAGTMVNMDAYYTVCNYFPAGNMGGQYGANVLAPIGKATVTV